MKNCKVFIYVVSLLLSLSLSYAEEKQDLSDDVTAQKKPTKEVLVVKDKNALSDSFEHFKDNDPKQLASHYLKMHKDDDPRKKFLKNEFKLLKGKTLKTWGFALFSGSDLISAGLRQIMSSKWSHVGIILIDQDGVRYCLESTGSASDIFKGIYPQVQIHPLNQVIVDYEGAVNIRPLNFPKGFEENYHNIRGFVYQYLGTPYENHFKDLWRSITENNKKEDATHLFCSELAALYCLNLGYFDTKFREGVASNFIPKDFCKNALLPWIQGLSLGNEVICKKMPKCACGCSLL